MGDALRAARENARREREARDVGAEQSQDAERRMLDSFQVLICDGLAALQAKGNPGAQLVLFQTSRKTILGNFKTSTEEMAGWVFDETTFYVGDSGRTGYRWLVSNGSICNGDAPSPDGAIVTKIDPVEMFETGSYSSQLAVREIHRALALAVFVASRATSF